MNVIRIYMWGKVSGGLEYQFLKQTADNRNNHLVEKSGVKSRKWQQANKSNGASFCRSAFRVRFLIGSE